MHAVEPHLYASPNNLMIPLLDGRRVLPSLALRFLSRHGLKNIAIRFV